MSVPTSVLAMLESQNVRFNVTRIEDKNQRLSLVSSDAAPTLVKSLLLQDGKGQVQALLPANSLLDLDAMHRQFGRKFEVVGVDEVRPMIQPDQLTSIPAIPQWFGMPTLVDTSLLKRDHLTLESGHPGHGLELNQDDFRTMIATANLGSFAVPCPKISYDSDQDVNNITSSVERFTTLRIQQRLEETLELPPLPETAQRIIKLRSDPDADISDLANIVEIDPSLAAQVVSWAASPYYSAPGKIKSVHDAIVRVLGFDMVLNLALGLSLGKALTMKTLTKKDVEMYWYEAVYTAAAVEGLVAVIDRQLRPGFGMAYLSGLLNNFGYIVLAEVFPPYFDIIKKMRAANPHFSSSMIEQHLIGVTGTQIASWLFGNWNMPSEVIVAVRQKTNTRYNGDHQKYPHLIYIAQQLLARHGFGDRWPEDIPAAMFAGLHLDPEKASHTVENILKSADDLNALVENMRG